MDVREKLVELFRNAFDAYGDGITGCTREEFFADFIAGYGVTVKRWISVKERLPKNGERVLAHLNSGSTYIADFDNSGVLPDWHKPNSKRLYCYVTHWMPLPPAPKGE